MSDKKIEILGGMLELEGEPIKIIFEDGGHEGPGGREAFITSDRVNNTLSFKVQTWAN